MRRVKKVKKVREVGFSDFLVRSSEGRVLYRNAFLTFLTPYLLYSPHPAQKNRGWFSG